MGKKAPKNTLYWKNDNVLKSGRNGYFAKAIETKLLKMAFLGMYFKVKKPYQKRV